MKSTYKYFIRTYADKLYSSGKESYLLRWDPNIKIAVGENVESNPDLELEIDKLKNNTLDLPKNDELYKVKTILPELFHDYYNLFLRTISDAVFLDSDEYFELDHSKGWFEIQYFAGADNTRNELSIRMDDSIRYFSISIFQTTR